MSFDLSAGVGQLYINDSVPGLTGSVTTDSDIDFTDSDYAVGSATGGFSKFNGDLADVFFHPVFLDLSIEANRRKFIDVIGKPVDLGPTGAVPLGFVPMVFLSGDADEFPINRGTGGGMTENGALTNAGTAP